MSPALLVNLAVPIPKSAPRNPYEGAPGSISASPTACLLRGYRCAGYSRQPPRREPSNVDILNIITIMLP